MKTTYYYGNIEFGYFQVGEGESSPLAIIHRINEVKEFESSAQAEHYYENQDESESYIGLDGKDVLGVQYELVFKKHA